ncbi:MAG: putative TetR-family transcriptional regulator [Microbacteriaceae bacterium]|nr:putative TetR-family transcriptional regulator [Microbacteriaceae bacterium]
MGRWEPDAQGRLRGAALELYAHQGFEQTTVAEIAARAGVTERTFFRYFADKREVLFAGSEQLQVETLAALAAAPASSSAIEAVAFGIERAVSVLADREYSRQRSKVIAANPSLQERELLKLAGLGAAMSAALQQRGVPPLTARLAAEAGVSVFTSAFDRWTADGESRTSVELVRESFAELRTVTAGL